MAMSIVRAPSFGLAPGPQNIRTGPVHTVHTSAVYMLVSSCQVRRHVCDLVCERHRQEWLASHQTKSMVSPPLALCRDCQMRQYTRTLRGVETRSIQAAAQPSPETRACCDLRCESRREMMVSRKEEKGMTDVRTVGGSGDWPAHKWQTPGGDRSTHPPAHAVSGSILT
jgi:hypothetical protein